MRRTRRTLRRPLGGWRARPWRREIVAWLFLAAVTLWGYAVCSLIYRLIDLAVMGVESQYL